MVSTVFIRDFLIGEADIASFSCYSKPPTSAGGAFTVNSLSPKTTCGFKIEIPFHEHEVIFF
jgi:hypothetical protein